MAKYEVVSGVSYPSGTGKDEKYAAPGEIVDDLPAKSIDDLLAIGAIKLHAPASRAKSTEKDTGGEE